MATSSKPSSPPPTQLTLPSSPVVEDEADEVPADKFFPVLKWKYTDSRTLMTTIQMSKSYGAIYPQEGDTVADAPAGMVTMFAKFFSTYNLRLPLTVSMVDLLEYYKTHISQLSPLGMVCARHFEYCFRSQNLESLVEDFRRFYQMHEKLWFYLFYL
ncbi:hypothetical protein HanRHA438_Chr01g0027471 [Helianthus annuus]|nr:hypothetical protein HanRHA438_Chr01g0027471 [Helianthus annuus]KAJ0957343.1 hypothetical protein HanPSC8_Chr01g0026161 [Helianthus annuus]